MNCRIQAYEILFTLTNYFYILQFKILIAVTRVQGAGGLLNKITDKVGDVVGIGGDDDKKDDDKKDEKKESKYII